MTAEPNRRPAVLAACLVFASTAVWVGTFLAVASGALSLGVAAVALASGAVLGLVAARGAAEGGPPLRGSGAGTAPSLRARVRGFPTLDVLALAAFAAVSVRQFGWLVFERGGTLLTLNPSNYGDLPLHWTYVQHFAGGAPFWPENPIVVGERLQYPLGVDLLTAILVVVGTGVRIVWPALGLAGAALAALALRRWGGALAVAGLLFSGGLAGFQVVWTGHLLDYQDAVAWKNLFLALFVPQRGFLLAVPAGLLLLWSWRRRLLRGESALAPWVEGLLWGALPLVHLHTFLMVSVAYAVWAVGGRRLAAAGPSLAWAVGPATWGVWEVTDGFRAASLMGWQPGWVIGDENPLIFLVVNFGLFLPLGLAALGLAWRARRREDLLVLGPALAVFAALFFVRLAPWAWDNTKVMLWCYLLALPPIEGLFLRRLGRWWRAATVGGLLFSGAVSVTAASLGGGPRLEVLDVQEYEAVCAALDGRPLTERVAVAPTFNHPVALCGHPVVMGYPGHLWSHGIDASRVEDGLEDLLGGGPRWREEARALEARMVFWGWRERIAFPESTRPWEQEGRLLASGGWGKLYALD